MKITMNLNMQKKIANHLGSNLGVIEIDDQMFLDKLEKINYLYR